MHTTFTPTNGGDCFPGAVGTYYWRVVAYDNPRNVVTDRIGAEVRRFTYYPDHVELLDPPYTPQGSADVPELEIPTLRWEPTAGAAEYEVTVTRHGTGGVTRARTSSTAWTPRNRLAVGTYRWQVQAVSMSGRLGSSLLPQSQSIFTVRAGRPDNTSSPVPTTPIGLSDHRFPTLTWTPVTDATVYQIWLRPAGTIGWSSLDDRFTYPAGDDAGSTWLVPDTYEFRIEAWKGNQSLGTGPTSRLRSCHRTPPPARSWRSREAPSTTRSRPAITS